MRIVGKVIGGVLGLAVTRHPLGLVVGALFGHAFDAGWLALPGSDSRATDGAAADNPYATLGVATDASDAHIDKTYRQLMAKYHPDRVSGAAEEIRELAEQRARAINAAYDRIQRLRKR
jgi:DnaJ-domain-containing protein 1